MTAAKLGEALLAISDAILESIAAAGPLGAPSGHLYAALITHGCTLDQYQSFMTGLEQAGLVKQSSFCFTLTDNGRKYMSKKAVRS